MHLPGGYRLGRLVAGGGMGEVYKGIDAAGEAVNLVMAEDDPRLRAARRLAQDAGAQAQRVLDLNT